MAITAIKYLNSPAAYVLLSAAGSAIIFKNRSCTDQLFPEEGKVDRETLSLRLRVVQSIALFVISYLVYRKCSKSHSFPSKGGAALLVASHLILPWIVSTIINQWVRSTFIIPFERNLDAWAKGTPSPGKWPRAVKEYIQFYLSSSQGLSFPGLGLASLPNLEFLAEKKPVAELFLEGNKFSEFPQEALCFKDTLRNLDLKWNLFETFPEEILQFTQLCRLNLAGNSIKKIPKKISKLTKLKRLILPNHPDLMDKAADIQAQLPQGCRLSFESEDAMIDLQYENGKLVETNR